MRYEAPQSFEEAAAMIAGETGTARVLAGGTDLLVQLRSGMVEPDLVVDIKRIPGALEITQDEAGFRIGAGVSAMAIGGHSALKAAWPGVVEAAGLIGSTQIQGRCTMSGNLCNGSPAADSVPALVAADASVEIVGPSGSRVIKVAELPTGPGKTSLARGEVVKWILLPARPMKSGDAYLRFIPRTEMDIAVVSAGVSLTLAEDGTVSAARVALGAVAPTVRLVADAGAALVGSRLEDTALEAVAETCRAACSPIDDKRGTIKFRKKVAGVLATRAARTAFDRAGA